MQFQVGQEIAWRVRGVGPEIRGRVFAEVPPYKDPVIHVGYKRVKGMRINFSGKLRAQTSYLVVRPHPYAGKKQDALCWPKQSEILTAVPAVPQESERAT